MGLESFVKTSGGKGLHVVVPLAGGRRPGWPEVKEFSRAIAESMAGEDREHYTANMSKVRRGGRIYLDTMRNERSATWVAPYSTRARAGAPVSAPLAWEELRQGMRSDDFDLRALPERLSRRRKDPWKGFFEVRQNLTAAMKKKVG